MLSRVRHLLSQLDKNHLVRTRGVISDNNVGINFCSNDYLNLASHLEVKKALIQGVHTYGLGSGASPVVSGYTKPHAQLEKAFAEFLNRQRALLFNSGYHANLGVMTTFADRNSTIIADKYCHASLIDGALLSRASYHRYQHHDLNHADQLLEKYGKSNSILVTESIFSMQGDITNIKALADLSAKHNTMLVVDDAHAIGVLGKDGKGIIEHYHLSATDVPCLITPLGKSLGSFGAIVSGSDDIIEAILQLARSYRYSTALPPAICCGTLAALAILKRETWRREKLHELARIFVNAAEERELRLASSDSTPIKSIIIGTNKLTLQIQKQLSQHGILVSCIRPPTVPAHTARLRISLNCMHTEQQIIFLLDRIKEIHDQLQKQTEPEESV